MFPANLAPGPLAGKRQIRLNPGGATTEPLRDRLVRNGTWDQVRIRHLLTRMWYGTGTGQLLKILRPAWVFGGGFDPTTAPSSAPNTDGSPAQTGSETLGRERPGVHARFFHHRMNISPQTCLLSLLITAWPALAQPVAIPLRIPANTAYLDPLSEEVRASRNGITHWTDPAVKVLWFGELKATGELQCSVALRLPEGEESKLRLTVAGQAREVTAKGTIDGPVLVRFSPFNLAEPGYQRFTLETLNGKDKSAGEIQALLLDGPAAQGAHFNLKSRKNAASVHLNYTVPEGHKIEAFYCEVTAVDDPLWTYYMACGWHRGYFGMQVNSPTERRIIFSVWDSGGEAVDRGKVQSENRVTLLAKGEGVDAGDFGNEGTGGHSHLVFPWKTGAKQRFLLTAKVTDATHTIYSGFYFHPEQHKWMLISSWKAPKDGSYPHGLYSFSENFGGENGHLRRKALYGNQWIRDTEGQWLELTTARFTHDVTGRADRFDRFMGVEDGQFFLSHGGFIAGFTEAGQRLTRTATGKAPADLSLPEILDPKGK